MMTQEQREELKRMAEMKTPGKWEVQTGCSWRRIGTPETDGGILRPTNHHMDGHPDLKVRGEDLTYMVAASNAALDLLAENHRMRELLNGVRIWQSTPLSDDSNEGVF